MKLLLLGATGLIGSQTLKLALSNGAISEVIAPTRQPLASTERLLNPVASRIEELAPVVMSHQPDAVICALGTTIGKAGSKQAFRYVDYELPIAFGKAAHAAGVKTYGIVTAAGAAADSMIFYTKTKGEAERGIREIGFESLIICRPSLIDGERNEVRGAEKAALTLARLFAPVLPKKFRVNPADVIAARLLEAVIVGKAGCHWIYSQEMT